MTTHSPALPAADQPGQPGQPGSLMEREIAEQPEVFAHLLAASADVADVAAAIHDRSPHTVMIVARGSSDHAALYLKYLLEVRLGLPTGLCSPSSTTLYGASPFTPGTLVVGISQSGGSPDLVATLAAARARGALTVALTNAPESALARAAELHLSLLAGTERSVAATKTYTAELMAAALLVDALAQLRQEATLDAAPSQPFTSADLLEVPRAAAAMLTVRDQVARVVATVPALSESSQLLFTARGYGHATAREGALKVMETCYVPSLAFSAADLLHGPFAMLSRSVATVALLASDSPADPMTEVVDRIVASGSPTITYGPGAPRPGVVAHVSSPHSLPAALAPIVDVVAVQYLALELSRLLGLDADAPRALLKVTSTL